MPLALSQIPQGFNYQAIARDGGGAILANTPLQVMFYVQSLQTGGTLYWKEWHSSVTTNSFGLFSLVVGNGTRQTESTVATFDLIDWKVTPKYLKTEIYYSSSWHDLGTSQLLTVPYAMVAEDLAGTIDKLAVKGTTSGLEEALFEVKNKDGQTVFAVYNEGVRVYVSNGAKAVKGGFAVGGFDMTKATKRDYLIVNDDSVRIYLDTNPLTKGKKSGFAVGGYDITKGTIQNYLDVSDDSVRVYIDSDPATKTTKGGFAVGGYDMSKGTNDSYLNVNTDASGIINPAQNRILWYPKKNAFLTGRVLIESSANVGDNSFASGYESKAIGQYSQALGYKCTAQGNSSVAIGYQSVSGSAYSTSLGDNNTSNGQSSIAVGSYNTTTGSNSLAIGRENKAVGNYTVAIGYASETGTEAYSCAIGFMNKATGPAAVALGGWSTAAGQTSLAVGYGANTTGTDAFAMGYLTKAYGSQSQAFGDGTTTNAYGATAFGWNTKANGTFTFAIGENTTAQSRSSLVIGRYNLVSGAVDSWNDTDPAFVIGNGTGDGSRSNAFTVLKNGSTGIGFSNPIYKLDVDGEITSRNSSSGISFRLRNSLFSTLIYHDNVDFYLLLTNSGDPDGIWNSYRPFKINYSTGNVSLGCNDAGSTYSMTARSDGDIYMPRIISSTSVLV